MKKQRKHYTPEEKVALLRRHLVEGVPISDLIVKREARGHPERNLAAEVRFLSSMLRRAQIRIGTRPLSEWLRGENRFEAKRGISPIRDRIIRKTSRTLP